MSLDGLKPAPLVDTVRFESEPPGAEAKTASGQTCRTPCALALPAETPQTVTFTLTGYEPDTESLEVLNQTGSPPTLRPNPVVVELTAAAPPPKPAKKRARKPVAKKQVAPKSAAAKPAASPAKPATPAPSSVPTIAAPEPQQPAPAPWPTAPKQ
jgi:hypothetical protein